jgi:hypothetical protein
MEAPLLIAPDGKQTSVTAPVFVIGRGETAQLMIELPSLSRQHASLTLRDDVYYIADLGSRNGTFINGARLDAAPQRLADGDEINLAGVVTFRYRDPSQTAGSNNGVAGRLRGVWIDPVRNDVWVDAKLLAPPLSRQQFVLLKTLYDLPGHIFTREELAPLLWSADRQQDLASTLVAIDGLVKRTQTRLRATSAHHNSLQFVRGRGIRLVVDG